MSLARLQERVPNAQRIGTFFLEGHELRFHKLGKDGSGKCDVYSTEGSHRVYGALFEIDPEEKPPLDRAEGLGLGYFEKTVSLSNDQGERVEAITYYATKVDASLKPFTWYLNHVLIGAKESQLPASYIQRIESVSAIQDQDEKRDKEQRAIHNCHVDVADQ